MTETATRASETDLQKAIGVAVAATERKDFEGAHELFRLIYEQPGSSQAPVSGLSHYGLCVQKVQGKTRRAVELADTARKAEFYDSRHWANLVRIHLDTRNRRRAISVLHDGLRRMPKDGVLLRLRDEMGYRRKPPIPFLHRDNPLNVFLGKRPGLLHPSKQTKIVVGVVWLMLLMGLTFWFLMKSSGF